MEKIVQLLKKGYKFCLHELATDCVTFGPKEDFVGPVCKWCNKVKVKMERKMNNAKVKEKVAAAYGDLKLSKLDVKNLNNHLKQFEKKIESETESGDDDEGDDDN